MALASPFQNGSFELNSGGNIAVSATGWTANYNGAAAGPDGDNNILFTNYQGATNGTYAAVFNADMTNGQGILSQSFDTTPGHLYPVTFDFGNYGGGTAFESIRINVRNGSNPASGTQLITLNSGSINNGTNSGTSLSQNGALITVSDNTGVQPGIDAPAPNDMFSTISFTFTALTSTSTISFTDISGASVTGNDADIDNIQIPIYVPEPASLSLSAIAFAILSRRRHRLLN